MKIYPHLTNTTLDLPYDEIKAVFNNFEFGDGEYVATGQVKAQLHGRCEFGAVTLAVQKKSFSTFQWDVSDLQIPIEFLDAVLSTVKAITGNRFGLAIRVISGEYHPVDSSARSFEKATFMALSNLVNFEHEKLAGSFTLQ